ncbi:hypothetical protein [Bacillus haynesii]|uniref:hypothetical protein n=1 Tax=Bacillus haynesii TaxID=1925021 RepID=UPI002282BB0C|nr:hypothetical protein [Bacillus haynesii]MCY7816190.1 hypothetical protein [Bacillus haynesii]MCY8240784.1 hypothetical protein [Bacillus haynesii]MCY8566689.1 hypothetical protein [Bacillus haynesii]MCY8661088.1 hypothetical protein [Bacillus haynesii]
MINTKFYDGFEGEPELVLTDGENKLIIWYGYFETVLDSLLDNNLEKRGIIKEYFNHEGWYDDSPWVIQDLRLTIAQMKSFDIHFLENAKNKTVVIEYD